MVERKAHSEGGQMRLDFLTPGSIFNRKTGLLVRFRLSACALEEACLRMDTEVPLSVVTSVAPPVQGVSAMQIRLMVLSQTIYMVMDLLCMCLCMSLVVLPWRVYALYRALLLNDNDRTQDKTDKIRHYLCLFVYSLAYMTPRLLSCAKTLIFLFLPPLFNLCEMRKINLVRI